METRTKTVHFTVDYEGFTIMLRNLWGEGKYTTVINVFEDLGIPFEHYEDILFGRLKMIDDPDGKPGIDGVLAEDNWKPNLANCEYGIYPTYADMPKMAERMMFLKGQYENGEITDAQNIVDEYNLSSHSLDKERMAKQLEEYPEYIRELVGAEDIHSGRFELFPSDDLPSQRQKDLPNVNEWVNRQLELDKVKEVKPDTEFRYQYGWILPDGKYYGCKWMEHIWLAGMLGKSEREAEELGWIKVVREPLSHDTIFMIEPEEREATQKQIDTIFDYCQVYGMEHYPPWIRGE